MPPKQTKTQSKTPAPNTAPDNSNESNESLDTLKQEWLKVVKDIATASEKIALLEKQRDELVSKLWEQMKKNPTETFAPELTEEKKSVKGKAKASDTPPSVPPPVAKSKSKKTVPVESDDVVEPPVAAKAKGKKAPVVEHVVTAKPSSAKTLVAKGKVSAPAKGAPKPKLDEDSEDSELPKPLATHESSSDTDLSSLSSVSSESEASGGEDN